MDSNALRKLTYGVFMISTKYEERANGCIIDTCMQVTYDPVRIAVSILNTNYTCELLNKSDVFALSILSEDCTFETIKYFGYQSGRNVDKFAGMNMLENELGIPYMGWHACAVLSGKVVEKQNLGTHTLFIAEVTEAKQLNEKAPLIYADYQNRIKSKA